MAVSESPIATLPSLFCHSPQQKWPDDPPNVNEQLSQMRTLVASLDNFKPNPDPKYLLRFLRAKKYNVDKAFLSYKKMHAARLVKPDEYFPRGSGSKEVMRVFELRCCAILPQVSNTKIKSFHLIRI